MKKELSGRSIMACQPLSFGHKQQAMLKGGTGGTGGTGTGKEGEVKPKKHIPPTQGAPIPPPTTLPPDPTDS